MEQNSNVPIKSERSDFSWEKLFNSLFIVGLGSIMMWHGVAQAHDKPFNFYPAPLVFAFYVIIFSIIQRFTAKNKITNILFYVLGIVLMTVMAWKIYILL
jgi:hypothetical protein